MKLNLETKLRLVEIRSEAKVTVETKSRLAEIRPEAKVVGTKSRLAEMGSEAKVGDKISKWHAKWRVTLIR